MHGVDIDSVRQIAAFPAIKRLAIHIKRQEPHCPTFSTFADIRERRPDLEFLRVGDFQYSREDATLKLGCGLNNVPTLTRVVNSCTSPVQHLVVLDGLFIHEVEIVANRFGGHLTSFAGHNQCNLPTEALLRYCGSTLTHVDLDDLYSYSLVCAVATTCPQLVKVSFHYYFTLDRSYIMDFFEKDFITLITSCRRLKELTLRMGHRARLTRRTFQTILDYRLHLKSLLLAECGLTEEDAKWFREQAKELQLFPAPIVDITGC